jgi:MFS family permease
VLPPRSATADASTSATATLAVAIVATALVALPTLLVGGLSVLIGRDLGFGEAELGTSIAVAFGAAALAAAPAGRLVERIGPRRMTWLGLGCGGAALLGIGVLAGSWLVLTAFLVLAGIGITTVQLGVNVLLARRVPPARQGIAFGVKQAAVPLASFLAGLAVPLVGLRVGWPAAFVLAAALVPIAALLVPDAPRAAPAAGGDAPRAAPTRGLVLLAIGVMLASAGGNSTPAFMVASSVARGLDPSAAGLVLAAGSLVGVLVRVSSGWVADRLGRGSLLIVTGLLAIGVVGWTGLALASEPALIVLFASLAFGGGWGWGGLVLLALSRTNPDGPGRAMGIVQVGPMTGAVIGPLVFGALAESVSFGAAWGAMAGFGLAGIATILVARRWVRRDLSAGREPRPGPR